MTVNFKAVVQKNTWIHREFIPDCICTECTYKREHPDQRFFRKPESAATKLNRRYESRRNTCTVCFTQKSLNGQCSCDT